MTTPIHPLALVVFGKLEDKDGSLFLSPSSADAVRQSFGKYLGGSEIREATRELVIMAFALSTRPGGEAVSGVLLDIARTAKTALSRLGETFENIVEAQRRRSGLAKIGVVEHRVPVGHGPAAPNAVPWWQVR